MGDARDSLRREAEKVGDDADALDRTMDRVHGRRRARRRFTAAMTLVGAALVLGSISLTIWLSRSPAPMAPSSFSPTPPPPYRIAYSVLRSDQSDSEIYVAEAGGVRNVSDHPGADHSPAWSPDGTRLAFVSDRDEEGNADVYVMDPDGSDVVRVTTDPAVDAEPAWSPDGSMLAFARADGSGHWEIYAVSSDGTGERRLTTNEVSDEAPSWSPDGSRIAFQRPVGTDLELFVMNADGTAVTRLTERAGDDRGPSWSPDGTLIAFVHDGADDGGGDVHMVKPDGSGPTELTSDPAAEGAPCWPDSTTVVFLRELPSGGQAIHVAEVATGEVVRLSSERVPAGLRTRLDEGRVWQLTAWGDLDVH